jgi:NAD(P)-dependent dehydrogenase (short-subunit alcohol dehydrogenase family)
MGLACAKKLTDGGWTVFALDRREPPALAGQRYIETDLTDGAAVKAAAETVRLEAGSIDCIVSMAGIYDLDSLAEMDEERFVRIFNVNLFAAQRVVREFLPLLSPGGRVVIVTSELAPLDPLPFTGVYAVTKAALMRFTDSLRMELQLLGHPVVELRPGAVDTGLIGDSTRALGAFTENTKLYRCNSQRFRNVVDRVEARKVPPERVADKLMKALSAKRPRLTYALNRNPLLLLLNALPKRLQCAAIRAVLKEK